jgi:hypothetical protein
MSVDHLTRNDDHNNYCKENDPDLGLLRQGIPFGFDA